MEFCLESENFPGTSSAVCSALNKALLRFSLSFRFKGHVGLQGSCLARSLLQKKMILCWAFDIVWKEFKKKKKKKAVLRGQNQYRLVSDNQGVRPQLQKGTFNVWRVL